MVGIKVAEPIVPIYLDKSAMRKLKMKDGQGNSSNFSTKSDTLIEDFIPDVDSFSYVFPHFILR